MNKSIWSVCVCQNHKINLITDYQINNITYTLVIKNSWCLF